jgi:hypothetical protein
LNAVHPAAGSAPPGGKAATILGIAWYWALIIGLFASFLFFAAIRGSIAGWRWYRMKHALYLTGERYAFRQLMRAPLALPPFLRALYRWWDRYAVPGKSCSLTRQLQQEGYGSIGETLSRYFGKLYGQGDPAARAGKRFKKEIRAYRKTAHLNC